MKLTAFAAALLSSWLRSLAGTIKSLHRGLFADVPLERMNWEHFWGTSVTVCVLGVFVVLRDGFSDVL